MRINRVISIKRFRDKFVANYCDVRLFRDFHIVKYTDLRLNNKDTLMYYRKFQDYYLQYKGFNDIPRWYVLMIMYCHAMIELNSTHHPETEVIYCFGEDGLESISCMLHKGKFEL